MDANLDMVGIGSRVEILDISDLDIKQVAKIKTLNFILTVDDVDPVNTTDKGLIFGIYCKELDGVLFTPDQYKVI